jgi:hypothetical protein
MSPAQSKNRIARNANFLQPLTANLTTLDLLLRLTISRVDILTSGSSQHPDLGERKVSMTGYKDVLDCMSDAEYRTHVPCEPNYREQCIAMQEFEEDRTASLKREGAREALEELQSFLWYCGSQDEMDSRLLGIDVAVRAIARQLADLDPAAVKGGAA